MIESILQKPEDIGVTDPAKLSELAVVRPNAHTDCQWSFPISEEAYVPRTNARNKFSRGLKMCISAKSESKKAAPRGTARYLAVKKNIGNQLLYDKGLNSDDWEIFEYQLNDMYHIRKIRNN
uniref:Uncharacterized protein n=1 Tax=Romanomermis culicivorax TaxID=13658 RepID=A0A915L504_ROMCU